MKNLRKKWAERKFQKVDENLKRKGSVKYSRNLTNQMASAFLEKQNTSSKAS